MTVQIDAAGIWDSETIADVAAATFPLACPPEASQDDIAAFIDEMLSAERFSEYLTDPNRTVLKVTENGAIVGYAMLVDGEPTDPDVAEVVTLRPTTEISKLYVVPGHHGSGVAAALMDAIVERARAAGRAGIWLGVNQKNVRAQRFYIKHGFAQVGTKSFVVGTQRHDDFVMERPVEA
ncbi:GNAT family N-acetyltransferase [Rhodococcus triatomae]|uniref:Ribosomal protein S18 acetylase RimI n=1 Tax=Rhodococcus triatomae TaxID=300028 RepID=A0A1G8KMY4_9NOCA|nr:GNAT family N-acetyltransferase [Rhodococcus triatomae]QNG18973.1 GNAT family N-acetyltransferase [Rhodococcus triatomae]QNG25114.1 GNAT family N-acetyltransferase [Rhodococcus triatomae]SDI44784.1 Ribosomal protein S18 acetylase RimI [Rhodococcus triatomae]